MQQDDVIAPRPPLALETQTRWGNIKAVGFRDGERFYMMIDKHGSVALMPADVLETDDAAH